MTIAELGTALNAITIGTGTSAHTLSFAHFAWSHKPGIDYGVYAEDGQKAFMADGKHGETTVRGAIDYFTRSGTGAEQAAIETCLNGLSGCLWKLESIQYEDDTQYIHYEWRFELFG